ncbi:MAG: porin [Pseudomonadota bacterium]
MKKTIPAVVLASLGIFSGVACAQSSVTVYGVVDAALSRDNNGGPAGAVSSLDSGVQSGSRLGFKGTEDLGGGLKTNFVLEMGINVDNGTSGQGAAFGRQAFVGLAGDFGTVNLGRQKAVTYDIMDDLDPFNIGLAGDAGRLFQTTNRRNNAITYFTPNLSGFTGSLQYGFGEAAGNNSASRLVGLSASYAAGPLLASLAYEKVNDATGNDSAKKTLVGATYNFGVAKAHAAYEANKGAGTLDTRVWLLGVSVPVGAGAILADYTRVTDQVKADANANQIAIGYSYNLSKRTNLYTSFSRTANDSAVAYNAGAKGATDKLFDVGIRHKF